MAIFGLVIGFHETKKSEDQKCDVCGKNFSSAKTLRRHIIQAHEKIKPFSCENCEKSYTIKSSLEYHIKSAHSSLTL